MNVKPSWKLVMGTLGVLSAFLIMATVNRIEASGLKPASIQMFNMAGGSCSGVHIGDSRFITAEHCVRNQLGNRIDGHEVSVLWSNSKYDVALIHLIADEPRAKMDIACRETEVGERITSVTNPLGLHNITSDGKVIGEPTPIEGMWAKVVPINVVGAPGSSGGPVLDATGRLIGIVVGSPNGYPTIVLMTPSSVICNLLGKGPNSL